MEFIDLLRKLDFENEDKEILMNTIVDIDVDHYIDCLVSHKYECFSNLRNELKDDLKVLKVHLMAALKSYEKYIKMGISESIFIDTMNCFARFFYENISFNGKKGFDRDFWTGRALSLELFRIGTLEYEFKDNEIFVHIPSNAILNKEKIEDSFSKLYIFIKKYFKDYSNSLIICESWIMSPDLENILEKDSNILNLQSYFEIERLEESESYKYWVFKNNEINSFIPKTSLEKNLIKYLREGNKFYNGKGIYKRR